VHLRSVDSKSKVHREAGKSAKVSWFFAWRASRVLAAFLDLPLSEREDVSLMAVA